MHQAFDTHRQRAVALKRLPATPAGGGPGVSRTRFRREVELAGRLSEPHVIPIHDFGEIDGQLYLDMRLVEGTDLATLLAGHGPLPVEQVVTIGRQVAAALDAAHRAGLVHRDVKPSNILVSGPDQDFVYLVDFGIGTGAPDRDAEDSAARDDHRSDIHALCRVLVEALTGSPPPDDRTTASGIGTGRRGVPPALETVLARGLAADPDDRQQRAEDLATELGDALERRHDQETPPEPSRRGRLRPPSRWAGPTSRWWVLAAAVGVVVLVAAVTVAIVALASGPGSPDPVAAEAVRALAARDRAGLDQVSCRRSDGRPTAQLPPDALALVRTARQAGPTAQVLQSEARTVVELTLASNGGPPQTMPAELILSVNDDRWCVNSLVEVP